MAEQPEAGWHRADIRAAVEKKGETLTSLARRHGLQAAACRKAVTGRHPRGERAIAECIGVPLWELWPDRWAPPAAEGGEPRRIDGRRRDDAAGQK